MVVEGEKEELRMVAAPGTLGQEDGAMKKVMVVVVAGAMLVGPMAGQALAGDREWAVAGKVLAGILVFDAITSPHYSTAVVCQQPVYPPPGYYRQPAYCPPPVVWHRPVVCHPPVVYRPPVVYYPPVCRPVRRTWRPPYRHHVPSRPVYHTSSRRGRHSTHGGRRR